jgi:outer membrane protein assembly factor BamB
LSIQKNLRHPIAFHLWGNNLIKKSLAVGIVFLFVFSSVIPMVVGYDEESSCHNSEENKIYEKVTLSSGHRLHSYNLSDKELINDSYKDYDKYFYPESYSSVEDDYTRTNFHDDKQNVILEAEETVVTSLFDTNGDKKPQTVNLFGPMDSPWPMQSHDAHHTGQSPYSTAYNPGIEKWRFETDSWIEVTPIIDNDGKLYFGCVNWYLYCLYPNGTINWMFRTDGMISGSSPAIAEDGTIYIGSWDCGLYAINSNGTFKWRFPSGGVIASSPTIGDDGTIYVGNANGIFSAINPDGTEKWQYDTGGDIYSAPAIDDDGTIYIGSLDSYLYALYPNGTLRWRFKTGDRIYGSPSIAEDGTIYIGSSWDSYLYALYPNGTLKWKYGGAGTPNNPSIESDGTIYSGYLDVLVALYPNGTLKWEFYIGDNRFLGKSAPAISADGIIYVGTNIGDGAGGEIIAVNSDGTERWRQRIADYWVDSSPSIGEDGTVYIGSAFDMGEGYLHAFGIGELEANAHGPYQGIVGEPVQFTGSASGGESPYSYHWDFGDEETSEEQNPTHEYVNPENFTVTLTVTDDNDSVAVDTTWALIRESNEPPNTPSIDGETEGNYGEPYDYTFITTDLDGDDVWYYIEWGDGTDSGWIGPYNSGEEITKSHKWSEKGNYTIKAKAKDVFDEESDWATLEVSMPRNKAINTPFLRFLENHPRMFPMLRKIFD